MGASDGTSSFLGRLLTWIVIAVVAIFAFKLALGLVGLAFRASLFMLFTVGPILLVGWVVIVLLRRFAGNSGNEGY